MKISIMTLFPDMCENVLSESIIGRARKAGHVDIACVNIRDYTKSKQKHVDDAPYGGGTGMVMQAQPIYDCFQAIMNGSAITAPSPALEGACPRIEASPEKPHVIFMSPQGATLTQERVKKLSKLDHVVLLCGHYEGVDERVLEEIVDEEISVGDYVLTGGELPACIVADSICRMLPGVLPNEEAFEIESHYGHLLEFPQYTRPAEWNGREVPAILLSGDHAKVDQWKLKMSLKRTLERRPDMLEGVELSKEEQKLMQELREEAQE